MNKLRLSLVATCLIALTWSQVQAEISASDLDVVRQLNRSFADIASKVSSSVVVISVVQGNLSGLDDAEDDGRFDSMPPGFLKKFHEQFQRLGQGSGVIVRENGYILTNGHVVEDAETVSVRLQNGRIYKAVVRGIDLQSDIAVLKIEAQGLPVATLADSSKTRVGEFAIAIGAPFGFDFSVTFGHVSAKSRSVVEGFEGRSLDQDFIQTDALINPGNSGGPLVNIEGQVIGINALIQGLHSGIGFAIPSNLAKEVSDQIIESGKFTRAYLGIGMRSLREETDLRELLPGIQDGVIVYTIVSNGPAAKSTLKPADVITAVDGQPVATPQELRSTIRGKRIGAPVTLDVFRQGKTISVKVSPSEWPEEQPVLTKAKAKPEAKPATVELGITVKPLTPALAYQLGTAAREGIIVATVEKNSPASRSGIKPGDIITSMDQQPITNRKQFQTALGNIDLKKGVIINLISGNTARFEIVKASP